MISRQTLSTVAMTAVAAVSFLGGPHAAAQSTPDFGPNVYIFDTSMSNASIQTTLTSLANESQFSTNRYAVLFKPGTYSVQSEVGYYESVAGLGQSPQAVTINGFLTSNQTDSNGNLTVNFWRSLENMAITSSTTLQWGVSQGADFRRMYINGPLQLTNTNCGQASGGFIADSVITGNVNPCSQQQWYTRNSSLGSWSGGVWNMVFSGVLGAPTPNYPAKSYTVLPNTPVSREKAFLYVDNGGNYNVFVPALQTNSVGTTWQNGSAPGYSLPISTFFIAKPSTPLSDINTALAYGQNLILTPGVYQYAGSINVTNPNTIVLGIGYATLVPQTGTAALSVADVDGVQISGLIIDAGPVTSPVLLQVGFPGSAVDHHLNPTSISDVSFRIGGATTGSAATSLEVDSNNVLLDNIWAWRADHGLTPTGWTVNTALNGVVVNGNNVTALGLAVEHYQQNQVLWNGNGGETIFYQSELPYDVPSQSAWMNGNANGYASYAVSNSVINHIAYGLGVYSFFNQGVNIIEDSAITVPDAVGVTVTDAVSVFLSGSGSITHTVNNAGTVAKSGSITSYLPFYQGAACTSTCPVAPSNVAAATISPTQINLTWTPSSSPGAAYSVFRGTTAAFTPAVSNRLTSGAAGTSFADTSAKPSTTYYYLVQANNSVGYSSYSNLASGTTPATGGVITTDVVDIDSGYSGAAPPTHWLADTYATGGNLRSTTHAISIPNGTVNAAPAAVYQTYRTAASFSYAIPNLTPGGSYIVDLHFADAFFATTGSRKFNASINGTQVLTDYDIVAASGGEYVANVQSFYATADSTGTITIAFSTGSANSPQVNGIEIGQGSIPVPGVPSGLSGQTVSSSQINLNWNASSTAGVQYEVFRSTTAGFTPSPANLITTTSATSYSDPALAAATTYYYLVEANNTYLTSLPSNQASAVTQNAITTPPSSPAAPTGLTAATISSSQINLLWTGSSTPNVQYQLFRGTANGFVPSSANLVTTTSATGYSDLGLAGSTTYYYVVEAFNNAGSSTPSNPTSAKTKMATPASVAVVSGSGQTAQVGAIFANPLVVVVTDAGGQPIPGVTVSFAGSNIDFPGGATAQTDAIGQAQVTAQPNASGSLTVTASIAGVGTPATFSENGTGIPQTISFAQPASPVTYGAAPVTLNASASSGLGVSFSVAGPATITGNTLRITGAGTVVVTASQAGDTTYAAATPVSRSVIVNPAVLTVTANDTSKTAGATNPAFTATYSGFVNGDIVTALAGSPTFSTTATNSSPVGTYPVAIALGTLASPNYTFTFVNGTLSVLAPPTIIITTTATLSKVEGGYQARITVTNTGTVAATNVQLTTALLGSVAGSPLPQILGTVAASGGSNTVVVMFPVSAGASGAGIVEKFTGTYTGGSFSGGSRAVLP